MYALFWGSDIHDAHNSIFGKHQRGHQNALNADGVTAFAHQNAQLSAVTNSIALLNSKILLQTLVDVEI